MGSLDGMKDCSLLPWGGSHKEKARKQNFFSFASILFPRDVIQGVPFCHKSFSHDIIRRTQDPYSLFLISSMVGCGIVRVIWRFGECFGNSSDAKESCRT